MFQRIGGTSVHLEGTIPGCPMNNHGIASYTVCAQEKIFMVTGRYRFPGAGLKGVGG